MFYVHTLPSFFSPFLLSSFFFIFLLLPQFSFVLFQSDFLHFKILAVRLGFAGLNPSCLSGFCSQLLVFTSGVALQLVFRLFVLILLVSAFRSLLSGFRLCVGLPVGFLVRFGFSGRICSLVLGFCRFSRRLSFLLLCGSLLIFSYCCYGFSNTFSSACSFFSVQFYFSSGFDFSTSVFCFYNVCTDEVFPVNFWYSYESISVCNCSTISIHRYE